MKQLIRCTANVALLLLAASLYSTPAEASLVMKPNGEVGADYFSSSLPKHANSKKPLTYTQSPVVFTQYGQIQGLAGDTGAYAFKGIPYAAPPVGKLRWAKTAPVQQWDGILNATEFSSGCMSHCDNAAGFPKPELMCPKSVSEDCLYLNIFTPTLKADANLPVILFIHGGDYTAGAGGVPLYDGGNLAMNQNVVVVTINYRLGVVGGLYTGTVKGNFQTLDQRESFKFTKNVISQFGGNPNKITITGQSAGAFSVATHMTAPGSWEYFQRGISVSNPFRLLANPPELAIQLGEKVLKMVDCPSGGDAELDCLRALPAEVLPNLTAANFDLVPGPQFFQMMMRWVPVVDGDVLPYQPLRAFEQGNINKVPYFFGTTANESVQFIVAIEPKPMDLLAYEAMLDLVFTENASKVREEYGPLPVQYYSDARPFLEVMATDYIFYCVCRHVGAAASKVVDTFMYFFDQLGTWNEWVFGKKMPYCVNNVCHAEDLAFIFNPFYAPEVRTIPDAPTPTPEEENLAAFVQTAWGNFARTGNPNNASLGGFPLPTNATKNNQPIQFPNPFDGKTNVLVNYSIPVSMLDGYRNKQCDFWDKIGYYHI